MQQLGDSVALMYNCGRGRQRTLIGHSSLTSQDTTTGSVFRGVGLETMSWIQLRARRSRERTLHMAGPPLESINTSNSGVGVAIAVFVAELLMTLDQLISSDYRRYQSRHPRALSIHSHLLLSVSLKWQWSRRLVFPTNRVTSTNHNEEGCSLLRAPMHVVVLR